MFGFGKKEEPEATIRPFLVASRDEDPNGPVMVQIDPAQVNGPEEVGIILADISNHFANALAMTGKAENAETALVQIRALFDAELNNPTQTVDGGLVQ